MAIVGWYAPPAIVRAVPDDGVARRESGLIVPGELVRHADRHERDAIVLAPQIIARVPWRKPPAAVTTYFGVCDSSGNPSGSVSNSDPTSVWWDTFTCPGSGTKTIVELTCDLHTGGGTVTVRCAIYNSAGTTLIVQGSSVTITGASDTWQGGSISGSLTGGTVYALALTVGSSAMQTTHFKSGTGTFNGTDYTGGFPASLPTSGNTTSSGMYPIRCGVQ